MKKIIILVLISALFITCTKEEEKDQYVRVFNSDTEIITNIKVGSVSFGDLGSNSITVYSKINNGTHTIHGNIEGTAIYSSSVSINGNVSVYWTIDIDRDGIVSLTNN